MTIVATIRPDSWNLPLFLHVLGATALFGTTATIAIVGFRSRARSDQAAFLSRLVLRIFLLGVVPAWILMRVAAQWIDGKEFPKQEPGWVGAGYIVSEGGGVFLIVVGILAWVSARRDGRGRAALAVPLIASVVLIALGVAWFAMSAKPAW
jgi:hypothetical protein